MPALPDPILICGQGLAGTLLAWALLERGQQVVVVDPGEEVTSSRVAAGIVTPITGKRVALSHEAGTFWTEAQRVYAAVAAELGIVHFHVRTQVRLWQNEEEPQRFAAKRGQPAFDIHVAPERPGPLVDPSKFAGPGEGFEMATSGWLDTRGWLEASAAWLASRGRLRQERLEPAALRPDAGGVTLPDGTRYAAIVFCEGADARRNPWFPWITWKCAKGEILTLAIPDLAGEPRIINQGGWLLPVDGRGAFRSGSTYSWDKLDRIPTAEARDELEGRLQRLLRVPWTVTGQVAAVRPIIHQSLARIGRHPVHPALAFFNGLGSKGVLHGPRYARLLAEHLLDGAPLPSGVDVARND
jgi:glycine oxidase